MRRRRAALRQRTDFECVPPLPNISVWLQFYRVAINMPTSAGPECVSVSG